MRLKRVTQVYCFVFLSICVLCLFIHTRDKNHSWIKGSEEEREAKETLYAKKNSTCLRRPVSHRLSILQRANLEDVRNEPFPHVIIKNALPESLYNTLERHFLSDSELVAETTGVSSSQVKSNYRYSVKADALLGFKKHSKIKRVSPILREFVEYHTSPQFVREVLWLFWEKLGEYRPDLLRKLQSSAGNSNPNLLASPDKNSGGNLIKTEVELVINSPVLSSSSSVRGYHHDKLNEIYAGLLYMRKKHDVTPGGNFQILRCKHECRKVPENAELKRKLGIAATGRHEQYDPKSIELDTEVVYERNTLAMFINSPVSVHAVTPRPKTKFARRYINVNADLKARQSEIVKEENCFKSGMGHFCESGSKDPSKLMSFIAENQRAGFYC